MGHVETFEHTADLGLRIVSTDLADLFRTAAEGLFDTIVANRDQVRVRETESLVLEADSPVDLLIAWLNELIYRQETMHRLYTKFEVFLSDDGHRLEATISGEAIDPDRHLLDHEVKAATYHARRLEQTPEGWMAEVVLDI